MKQVIVIRNDLNMRKGKIAVQAAHAAMLSTINHMLNMDFKFYEYAMKTDYKKICVYVNSEENYVQIKPHMIRKLIRSL